jgi:hypothetical protein
LVKKQIDHTRVRKLTELDEDIAAGVELGACAERNPCVQRRYFAS